MSCAEMIVLAVMVMHPREAGSPIDTSVRARKVRQRHKKSVSRSSSRVMSPWSGVVRGRHLDRVAGDALFPLARRWTPRLDRFEQAVRDCDRLLAVAHEWS